MTIDESKVPYHIQMARRHTELKLREFVEALIKQRIAETINITRSYDELAFFIDEEINQMLQMIGSNQHVNIYAMSVVPGLNKTVCWQFRFLDEVTKV